MKNKVAFAAFLVVIVSASALVIYQKNNLQTAYSRGYADGRKSASNLVTDVQFNSTELQNFENLKSRLVVSNIDPAFDPAVSSDRTLQWISMRNSSSAAWDPYQKSMEYLCFWRGQDGKGEWEAVVSIYNRPGDLSNYVVEVARFTWHQIQVTYNGNVTADFPQVASDTTSLGYRTFSVQIAK